MTSSGYAAPLSLNEAVTLLASNPGARVLAGGHTLLVEPSRSQIAGSLLVDLRKIQGLAGAERQPDGSLKIGAMTTVASIATSDVIRKTHPALAEAARTTGDAQARNRATLGGNLAAADPEADLPALILTLEASIHVVGSPGARTLPANALFTGPFRTALRPDEVITAVTVPAPAERSGMAYERFRHPATLYAICGVAAKVTLAKNGGVTACCVAVTGAAEHAARLLAVEQALVNKRPTEATVSAAANAAGEGTTFRGDLFASGEYRRHLTRVLTERALKRALERAAA